MPSAITDEQLAELRLKLRERRTECQREIHQKLRGTESERYADFAGSAHDLADESVADLLSDLGVMEVDRLMQEVDDIETALLRISHGTYGRCADCGGVVAYQRLAAFPAAKRCQPCQKRYEGSHAGVGHATL